MALFTEGKLFKKAGEGSGGGGGGDQHNLGWYATQAALEEAHPTATAGDWAIVGSTDTVWIWDTDTNAWKDSDQKGQVTSVNGQTGDVVLDLLPDQTGQSGKFLTTDGSAASWATINALTNNTTANNSIGITNIQVDRLNCVVIGQNSKTAANQGTAIGSSATTGWLGVAVGNSSNAGWGSDYSTRKNYVTAIGANTNATANNAIAIGYAAQSTAAYAIQLGSYTEQDTINADANTFKVANQNGNFEIMSADGTIPKERLTKVVTTPATMPTLAVADWSSNTQTVNVTGVTATNTVFVSPAPASAADYASAGIVCTAQGAGTLTFTCTTTPTNAITVNVVCL